jgi:hypothetical protein
MPCYNSQEIWHKRCTENNIQSKHRPWQIEGLKKKWTFASDMKELDHKFSTQQMQETISPWKFATEYHLTYLKSYKPIYVDLGIWKFSTPNIEKHEHKWYPQERAPKNGDRRKYLESKRKDHAKVSRRIDRILHIQSTGGCLQEQIHINKYHHRSYSSLWASHVLKDGPATETGSQIRTGEYIVNLDEGHFSNFSSSDELGHAMNNLTRNFKWKIRDLIQGKWIKRFSSSDELGHAIRDLIQGKWIKREDNHTPIMIELQRSSSTRNPLYAFQTALSPTGLHILLCTVARVNREALVLGRKVFICFSNRN